MPRCRLVQLSDYVFGDRALPARAVPGDGAIPLEPIIGMLLEAGYTGVFDLELLGPRIDAEGPTAAVARGAAHVSTLLDRLKA
jgi:sugar phosphate isomerase/epimerase